MNKLLEILHNNEQYGDEIKEIYDCSDKYCIEYFEKALDKILNTSTQLGKGQKYYNIKGTQWGLESVTLKGFNLTKEDVVKLDEFICACKLAKEWSGGKYVLSKEDGNKVIEYIDSRSEINENKNN